MIYRVPWGYQNCLLSKSLLLRREIGDYYKKCCEKGNNKFLNPGEGIDFNYAYFPVIINSSLKIAREMFKKYKVEAIQPFERPLFEKMNMDASLFPNAQSIALKLLSMPIYPVLSRDEVESVGKLITSIR